MLPPHYFPYRGETGEWPDSIPRLTTQIRRAVGFNMIKTLIRQTRVSAHGDSKGLAARRALARPLLLGLLGLLALGGCEAPLNLQKVGQEQDKAIHRFDHMKAMAASESHVVAGSDAGVLLVSDHAAAQWQRVQLPTKAAILSLTACPNGRFTAVDTRHTLWVSNAQAQDWQAKPIDTTESLMGLGCDAENRVWVGASFSTLLSSEDFGETWQSVSMDEDLQFTVLSFAQGQRFAAGEFGTLMVSEDGEQWQAVEPIPNELYPMGLHFANAQQGWVSGLGGTIYYTADGGNSWERQEAEASAPLYNFVAMGERLFAVGDNGTLLERNGDQWQRVPNFTPIPTYLVDGVGLSDGRLLLAGGGGTVIELKPEAVQ